MDIGFWKDLADTVQGFTVFAVAIGGSVLYLLRRQRFPRAKIEQTIHHRSIDAERLLLFVVVTITNCGEVRIRMEDGVTWVRKIMPGAPEFLDDPKMGESLVKCGVGYLIGEKNADIIAGLTEIEPGEEQEFCFEFILPSDVQTLAIYSHFGNVKKRKGDLGWNRTTWYQVHSTEENRRKK